MMPISSLKPVQLDVTNSFLDFPLRIPFFQMFPAEEEKAQKGKQFNLHWECVQVCVCRQGNEAARPMALPVFKWTVHSNTNYLFGRSILKFVIIEKVADIVRGERTCQADKTKQPAKQLLQHLSAKFPGYMSGLKMLTFVDLNT